MDFKDLPNYKSEGYNLDDLPKSQLDPKFSHFILISFYYGSDDWERLYELERKLWKLLEGSKIGFFDGHEMNMDGTDGTLWFYAVNAEELYRLIHPILKEVDFLQTASAYLRFGPVDNEETKDIEIQVVSG